MPLRLPPRLLRFGLILSSSQPWKTTATSPFRVAITAESEFRRHVRDSAGHYIAMLHLRNLLNPFLGIASYAYWSHRVLRWMTPFFLIFFPLINVLLFFENPMYVFFMVVTSSIYGLALIGYLIIYNKMNPGRFVTFIYYFFSLNFALLIGFFMAISGKQGATWNSTIRISKKESV